MPAAKRNIGDEMRGITREALEHGKLDRSAVRKVTGAVRKRLTEIERAFAQDLRLAARAGKDAAGIADSLAAQKRRRRR